MITIMITAVTINYCALNNNNSNKRSDNINDNPNYDS